MLKSGACVEDRIKSLYISLKLNNPDIHELISSETTESKCPRGMTVLHHACLNNNSKVIEHLINLGADVITETISGRTPLSFIEFKNKDYMECIIPIIKEIAKLSFEKVEVSKQDIKAIMEDSETSKYFNKCRAELKKMADEIFYPPFSYYSVMKMSKNIKKLACLTKIKDFERKFIEKMIGFENYENEIWITFEDALSIRNNMLAMYDTLQNLFGNLLPDVAIRNLASDT